MPQAVATRRPVASKPVAPGAPAPTHDGQLPRVLRLGAAVAWVVIVAIWALLEAGHLWRRFRARMD